MIVRHLLACASPANAPWPPLRFPLRTVELHRRSQLDRRAGYGQFNNKLNLGLRSERFTAATLESEQGRKSSRQIASHP
jgi:hypothetical protein